MSQPLIMRIMALAINTSQRAGVIIRDVMQNGNLGIVDKGKDDLQTEADRSAQRCIIASLTREFPNIKIIGEEGGLDLNVPTDWLVNESSVDFLQKECPPEWTKLSAEDFVIWVDPLDGTSEFTQGLLDHVTVLIGVAVHDRAVGGVIYQPYYKCENTGELGRIIWGLKGLGTHGFTHKPLPKDKLIVTTTRSHNSAIVQCALNALAPDEILKVGGAGYKVLQLLEGNAHAYVYASAGCKKWDTCAPEAVLEAFGGVLTDILGKHYAYGATVEFPNNSGVLATVDTATHCNIVQKMPAEVLQKFRNVK